MIDQNSARRLGSPIYLAIKARTRLLIERVGGVDVAIVLTRVGQSQLYDYGNDNKRDKFMPADVMADLEDFAGQPILSSFFAGRTSPESKTLPVVDHVLGLVEKVGATSAEIRAASHPDSPGGATRTPQESARILGTISAIEEELAALKSAVETGGA
jgi:hypothetical protein